MLRLRLILLIGAFITQRLSGYDVNRESANMCREEEFTTISISPWL